MKNIKRLLLFSSFLFLMTSCIKYNLTSYKTPVPNVLMGSYNDGGFELRKLSKYEAAYYEDNRKEYSLTFHKIGDERFINIYDIDNDSYYTMPIFIYFGKDKTFVAKTLKLHKNGRSVIYNLENGHYESKWRKEFTYLDGKKLTVKKSKRNSTSYGPMFKEAFPFGYKN